jgi:uncharacterized phage infection (PIP) family protein YhgE
MGGKMKTFKVDSSASALSMPIGTYVLASEAEALEAQLSAFSSATSSYVEGLEAEVERLRQGLNEIIDNISADKPSCTYCHHTVRVAIAALEASR